MRFPALPNAARAAGHDSAGSMGGRGGRGRRFAAAAALAATVWLASPASGHAQSDTAPPPTTVSGYVDNPFIPTEANLGDCVSALPRPGCGSEARGGGAQMATFGVMTTALVFIAWRVTRAIRRRDRGLQVRPDA